MIRYTQRFFGRALMTNNQDDFGSNVPVWQPVLVAAMAGGLAWGIRGQYGHETGAMIAGLLVSFSLVYLFCPRPTSPPAMRAVAWGTVAMGFGGSMTYGQTVGLTHDPELVGHHGALMWGFLGLSIKGACWIGFAGAFLGMGLGGKQHRPRELFALGLAMLGAYFIGTRLLNYPFYPADQRLPLLYFSDHWRWEPDKVLEPRREAWGGLLFALATVIMYFGVWRRDRLARNLGLWGILGGAIGFPLGQSLQALHMWHPEFYQSGIWERLDPHMNWWNMMEITFGTTMGACLGLGLWLNRRLIAPRAIPREELPRPYVEWILLAIHVPLLAAVEFRSYYSVDVLYDLGLIMGIIPIVAIAAGRFYPYLQILPITLLPIAGKTLRQLSYREESASVPFGWIVYFVVPMIVAVAAAVYLAKRGLKDEDARTDGTVLALGAVWMYFLLNFAFFHFPWPWAEWTGRTPSGIIYVVFSVAISCIVLLNVRRGPRARPMS